MAKNLHRAFIIAAALGISAGAASAGTCLPAKGKIFNNGQPNGSTQGVVALVLGTEKLKCAIVGIPQFPAPPSFKHTVVCDAPAATGEAQDQITFDSTLVGSPVIIEQCANGAPGVQTAFTFKETAVADPATGRGGFRGVEGQIRITGAFNCNAGIRMEFEGALCFPD